MSANGRVPTVRLGRMVEDGVAPSIFGLIERGIAREPELAAQMRGRVVFRFAEDFSPLRITFRPRSVVVEDGDSRKPDLVISGRLPDIVHFATVPTLRGRLTASPTRASPAGGGRSPARQRPGEDRGRPGARPAAAAAARGLAQRFFFFLHFFLADSAERCFFLCFLHFFFVVVPTGSWVSWGADRSGSVRSRPPPQLGQRTPL